MLSESPQAAAAQCQQQTTAQWRHTEEDCETREDKIFTEQKTGGCNFTILILKTSPYGYGILDMKKTKAVFFRALLKIGGR